jgi:4-amino-4-deoxy-L-arabinose transferase-like glycosyltransferase
MAIFAGLVFLPYLGAVGLWDPWETHYGEVAREMIQRNDFVHPYWENAWFFSKPVFTMWMHVVGMAALGSDIAAGAGALGRYTEWGFRLPFALFSITAVTLVTYALARIVSLRAGLATGFVLATTPIYFFITRQAVTDTPIISATLCAMSCGFVASGSYRRVLMVGAVPWSASGAMLLVLADGVKGVSLLGAIEAPRWYGGPHVRFRG